MRRKQREQKTKADKEYELLAIKWSIDKWEGIIDELENSDGNLLKINFGAPCGYCKMQTDLYSASSKCDNCPVYRECDSYMSDIYMFRDSMENTDHKITLLIETVEHIIDFLKERRRKLNG